jgi:hypothetical protein
VSAAEDAAVLAADARPGVYASFFAEMEALGLASDLEDSLPDGFSAVFEIGRMLDDPSNETAAAIGRALVLAAPAEIAKNTTDYPPPEGLVEAPVAQEYEAEMIRSWSDVPYVYSWQHLLPEEVFLRRLADRTLWFPMAKAPLIRRVEGGEDDFSPTPSKQKAYVLLDTSASMALHHRFALAKAAALRFLRQNRRELGEVFLRTFDVDVGPLHFATDVPGYDALLRRVARQQALGNGTCLERAILTACEDVRDRRALAGAEILVVTDGAARLDEEKIRAALGSSIRLNCVKIGNARVFATDAYVAETLDFARGGASRRDQRILQVRERREKIVDQLKIVHDDETRDHLRHGLRECDDERRALAEELKRDYGREIERLCEVYVEVPDLDTESVFRLDDERLAAVEALVRAALEHLERVPASPEAMKEAALLLAHLSLLSAEQTDQAAIERLAALRAQVAERLEDAIEAHEVRVLETGLLSPGDQRDLRVLLGRGADRHSSLWLALLRYFYAAFARFSHRRGG